MKRLGSNINSVFKSDARETITFIILTFIWQHSLPFDPINFYKLDTWKNNEDKLIPMFSVNTVKFLLLSARGLEEVENIVLILKGSVF